MNINKGQISNLLRRLGLMHVSDKGRYFLQRIENKRDNRDFKKRNPHVKLPPDYLIYESFQMNYRKYFTQGVDAAEWVVAHLEKHIDLKNKRILDWGCGPGRIIRHLPNVIGNGCEYYGTDYNKRSIGWCSKNLPGIQFNNNSIDAKLPYRDNFMDVIYGISIFTHLSERLHYDWYDELYRVLKPNGVLFLTTQGDNFKVKLTDVELNKYNDNELVVRGKVKEGHRTYSAFHPRGFMMEMFGNADVLEHVVTQPGEGKWLPQDIWIVKKK